MERVWVDRWWNMASSVIGSLVGGIIAGIIVYLAITNLEHNAPARITMKLTTTAKAPNGLTYRVRADNTSDKPAYDCWMNVSNHIVSEGGGGGVSGNWPGPDDLVTLSAGQFHTFEYTDSNQPPSRDPGDKVTRDISIECDNASTAISNVPIPK